MMKPGDVSVKVMNHDFQKLSESNSMSRASSTASFSRFAPFKKHFTETNVLYALQENPKLRTSPRKPKSLRAFRPKHPQRKVTVVNIDPIFPKRGSLNDQRILEEKAQQFLSRQNLWSTYYFPKIKTTTNLEARSESKNSPPALNLKSKLKNNYKRVNIKNTGTSTDSRNKSPEEKLPKQIKVFTQKKSVFHGKRALL